MYKSTKIYLKQGSQELDFYIVLYIYYNSNVIYKMDNRNTMYYCELCMLTAQDISMQDFRIHTYAHMTIIKQT